MMVSRTNVKYGITGALLFMFIGALSACAELPTASVDEQPAEQCVWIDHMIHCRDV